MTKRLLKSPFNRERMFQRHQADARPAGADWSPVLLSYISTEDRTPASHPLRQVRRLADQALDRPNPTFCRLDPEGGRALIPPEQLLLDTNQLFRCFVGLNPGDPVWHLTAFTKNRGRLLNDELMARVLEQGERHRGILQ